MICRWGTDTIRIIVAGELSREKQNAPLHLFSAKPELAGFGQVVYKRNSANTSSLLEQLFLRFQGEGITMYTMEDFQRDYAKKYFPKLTPQEQEEVLKSLPPEARLAGLPPEGTAGWPATGSTAGWLIRRANSQISGEPDHHPKTPARKPRRKK